MVYCYYPETFETRSGLKLIDPSIVPRGEHIPQNIQDVRAKAQVQASKYIAKQKFFSLTKYKVSDEVLTINPNKSKIQPSKVGPFVVVKVNHTTNTSRSKTTKVKSKAYI